MKIFNRISEGFLFCIFVNLKVKGEDMQNKIELKKNGIDKGFDKFIFYCKVRNLRSTTIKYYNDVINTNVTVN